MLSNCAYALVAPFLPLELEKAGISKAYTGPIFSMYSVAVIICSPIIGKYIKQYGRRNFVQFGLIAMSLSMFGFAIGSFFKGNLVVFLAISLLTRFI
jgi:MFS family permease